MDKALEQSVSEILNTFAEGLTALRGGEDGGLRALLAESREKVTGILESALGCSLEKRIGVSRLSDEDWLRSACLILDELSDPIVIRNGYDREFLKLLDLIWSHSEEELVQGMRTKLDSLRKQSRTDYHNFVRYFAKYPLWGSFDPAAGDFTTFQLRAEVLKRHSYDFLWLYQRLGDYLSKRTLTAILLNWAVLDFSYPVTVKSIFPDYWEPDIFPDNTGDVLVDVGAYNGDSVLQYVRMYGTGYNKIYAYEISADSFQLLRQNLTNAGLHDVVLRRKGAGKTREQMYVGSSESDASANQLRASGAASELVEVVPLDEDLEDTPTFIKMDIEGAEQNALLGLARTIRDHHPKLAIRDHHPKLAICVYHGYEDLWKIPAMIDRMNPDYHFFLRHNGGNLIPTEFVLLCR